MDRHRHDSYLISGPHTNEASLIDVRNYCLFSRHKKLPDCWSTHTSKKIATSLTNRRITLSSSVINHGSLIDLISTASYTHIKITSSLIDSLHLPNIGSLSLTYKVSCIFSHEMTKNHRHLQMTTIPSTDIRNDTAFTHVRSSTWSACISLAHDNHYIFRPQNTATFIAINNYQIHYRHENGLIFIRTKSQPLVCTWEIRHRWFIWEII